MKIYSYDAIVIGSGAAGYNAICRLKQDGVNAALITEGVSCGTSRNTGSDKQTYYKLGLGGDAPDSVAKMARNLFDGGCVDGDNALCEAALSARCFMHLCELGVAFPTNRYGEYVGYKTDHDPYSRATSAGPLTSKFMTEALQKEAARLGADIFDGLLAVEILKKDDTVCGVLCLDKNSGEFAAFRCGNVVMCTGGPAAIYADSVYPVGHTGSTALALLAGAKAQNLSLWQYGLASVAPRWNVSGSYMQVLPRLVSLDADGTEHEFLLEHYPDEYTALSTLFLKGYQWPFDPKKAENGSSVIDLLVYRERVTLGRKVYLDFTKNPFGLEEIEYNKLSAEAFGYLKNAEVTFGTPIQRLEKMNAPAIRLYRSKGVDISREYLEIALCAQHNNGGIAVDMWWQSSVKGLFAAGECAGTHGISRPGGSALNAGQVGSLRAAQYIAAHPSHLISIGEFEALINGKTDELRVFSSLDELTAKAQRRMSACAAAVRDKTAMQAALAQVKEELDSLGCGICSAQPQYYKLRDILVTQVAVLTAMLDAEKADPTKVQETYLTSDGFCCSHRRVRPIPENNDFFENIWRGYRQNKNIF